MSAKNDGGAAFPKWIDSARPLAATTQDAGMSLRDYFAAAAMKALLDSDAGHSPMEIAMIAVEAYEMADAMLTERNK